MYILLKTLLTNGFKFQQNANYVSIFTNTTYYHIEQQEKIEQSVDMPFESETIITDTQFPYSYKYTLSMNNSFQESEISMIELRPIFSGSTYYSQYYPVIYTTWYNNPCRRVIPVFENFTGIYINFGILCTHKFTNWEFYLYMDKKGYDWLQNWKETQVGAIVKFIFYKKTVA